MRKKAMAAVGGIALVILAVFSFQGEKAVASDTTVVLYNSAKIGVVEKTLELELEEGINDVPLEELAGLNIAEVTIMSLDEGVRVLGIFSKGQGGDVYSANIGSEVEIKLRSGDTVTGKFLGFKNGKIAIEGDGYYLINPNEVVYFKARNLEGQASVYAAIQADKAGKYNVSITYRVANMSWESRYKLYIGDDARLYGYIVLNNPTAQEFKDAKVLLVAGDVQLYQNVPQPRVLYAMAEKGTDQVNVGQPEKIEAFYLYKLGVVDLNPSSKMMYPYISFEVPFEREYLYESWPYSREGPVYESISFKTEKVLPAGIVEIYRETDDGSLLVGERAIEHTPRGDVLRIGIGRDYDLKGTTTVLDQRNGDGYSYYKVKITLENFGNETKTVIVRHHKWGKVVTSNVEPINETANYVEFKVTINPGEKKEIIFDYENRY
ncbi:hypothetical protein CL1_0373 [Thermococcus cleftensis]|uniref:DUF4139 domain-containing protein n=1 Tax=Thermococcus cleftensis (strain DSM 27260 / KACC 17922 / CL1) TaxID=163003 RepID=I3ZSA0_THECF|nr:hypothetical protein [Thermococcus cleftensis]AFL94584.1 hypothetical protein CL1_0373 [Thermococcus cleftensis]